MARYGLRNGINGLRHDHIDGSAAVLDVVDMLYSMSTVSVVAQHRIWTPEGMRLAFADVHTNIVTKFSLVTQLLQSKEALFLMGRAYAARRAAEGYTYIEPRFAPQYHTLGGLSIKEAGQAMYCGLKSHGTLMKVIPFFSIGREANQDVGIEVARAALEYDGEVGLDMACDEARNPPQKHLAAYEMTFGTHVRRDCHAGEWVKKGPVETYYRRLAANVEYAVKYLKSDQIGHAIPLGMGFVSDYVMDTIIDQGIVIGGCPLSNVETGAIHAVRALGIPEMLDRGIRYTVNPDDDLFLPSMEAVVDAVERAYGRDLTEDHWRKMAQTATET